MADPHQRPPSPLRSTLLIPLLLFAIVAGFYWRLTLTNQYTWLESPDLARQVLPWFQFQVGEFQQGRIPLWDPYMLAGQPLLGQAQPGTAYPLNWLLFLMPTRDGWIQERILNWYFVTIHLLAALFAYLLCRDWGYTRRASVIGGAVFALGAYVGQIDWPQMINGAVWTPLVLLFVTRSLRGHRIWASAAFGGLCLGMAFLAGHHQVPIFVGLMAAGAWLWGVFRNGFNPRLSLATALFFVVGGLISAAQFLPALEYSKLAYRWVSSAKPVTHTDPVPYIVHHTFSVHAKSLFGIVFPGASENVSPLIGFTAAFLACIAVLRAWRRSTVRFAICCCIGSFLFALGSDNILHGLLYGLVPALDKARSPAMAIVVFGIGAATLVAAGVDQLFERNEPNFEKGAFYCGAALLGSLLLLALFHGQWSDSPVILVGLSAMLLAGTLRALRTGSLSYSAATALILCLILFDLGRGPINNYPHNEDTNRQRDLPKMADPELIEQIRRIEPTARWDISDEVAHYNFGDWHGIQTYGGYLASLTRAFWEMEPHNEHTRRLWGVKYWVGKQPLMSWNEAIYESNRGWKIYRNPQAFPLIRTLHQATGLKNLKDMQLIFATPNWDYAKSVFVYGDPPDLETCGTPDETLLLRREPSRVAYYAEMACRGMAVLADNSFPGWEAVVDGKPAKIWDAYTAQRGVVLDKGRHVVEFRYRPKSVYIGLALTLVGMVLTVAVSRLDRSTKP
ncbi:MAG: hypothetical protein IT168_17215 [Bryobacterales bacterium]|nr:hypothetical protein [Bryobacterales bacterium]